MFIKPGKPPLTDKSSSGHHWGTGVVNEIQKAHLTSLSPFSTVMTDRDLNSFKNCRAEKWTP